MTGRVGRAVRALPAAALLAALLPLGGCASDQEQYCDAVEERQEELADIASEGGPTALLDALPVYRELQAEAPRDIRDEWDQVVTSLEGLQAALDDAGVDPADFDPDDQSLPAADREAIADAADEVGSRETQLALAGLEQQARDVCKVPLGL